MSHTYTNIAQTSRGYKVERHSYLNLGPGSMSILKTQVFQAGITRMQHTHTYAHTQHVVSNRDYREKTEVNTSSYTPRTHVQCDTATVKLFAHAISRSTWWQHSEKASRNTYSLQTHTVDLFFHESNLTSLIRCMCVYLYHAHYKKCPLPLELKVNGLSLCAKFFLMCPKTPPICYIL